jgi:hypothetical protein
MATTKDVLDAVAKLDAKFTAYVAKRDAELEAINAKHAAEMSQVQAVLNEFMATIPVEAATIP